MKNKSSAVVFIPRKLSSLIPDLLSKLPVINSFLLLISMQCSYSPVFKLQDVENEVNELFRIMRRVPMTEKHVESELVELEKRGYIAKILIDDTFYVTRSGKEYLNEYLDLNWVTIEELVENLGIHTEEQISSKKELLVKYVVENMPASKRIERLKSIIRFLTIYYKELCWEWQHCEKDYIVPFHLLTTNNINKVSSIIAPNPQDNEIEYADTYLEFYKTRDKAYRENQSVPRNIYNGSVYRLLDWNENHGTVTLHIGIDKGYIDFQSTCGKIRNEIDHAIEQYIKFPGNFYDKLVYRKKTLHQTNNVDDVLKYLKKRVVKIGIETCVVIVNKGKNGQYENPRIPIIYRNEKVAEYPRFSMVTPSGAYQASLLMENQDEGYFNDEIDKRLDWKVSAIREMGEELLGIESLEKYNIENLKKMTEYKLCEEIIGKCECFKPTGFGIDLYIGSGNLLATLILDYDKTMEIIDKYAKQDGSNVIRNALEHFKNLNEKKADEIPEGSVYLFMLDDNLTDHVLYHYSSSDDSQSLGEIWPTNTIKPVDFPPMIPSGVVSFIHAKCEYEKLLNRNSVSHDSN